MTDTYFVDEANRWAASQLPELLADIIDPAAWIVGSVKLGAVAATKDGSVGQTYSAPGMIVRQWYRETLDSARTRTIIVGAVNATYVAQDEDVGYRLIARGVLDGAFVDAAALQVVMPAPIILDAMDATAGHTTVGSGTTLSQNATTLARHVQGVNALQVDALAAAGTAGIDHTGSTSLTPAELGVVALFFDRLTDGVISSNQIFLHAGTPNGNILIGNDASQLQGGRFISFNVSEIAAFYEAAADNIRVRSCVAKSTSAPASFIYDSAVAKAGGRPTVLLRFDDGYKTIRDVAYAELSARGMKATVFPAPTFIESGGSGDFSWMTIDDLRFLDSQGWLIGCDGTMDDTAISSDPATAVAVLNQVRAWITEHVSPRGADFGCYPFGNHQSEAVADAIIDLVGMKLMIGTQLPAMSHTRFGFGRGARKKFPSQGIAASTNPATVLAQVDQAILRGQTMSIHMHSFTEATGNAVFIPSSVYTPLLDGLAERRDDGDIDILTYDELWSRDGGSAVTV